MENGPRCAESDAHVLGLRDVLHTVSKYALFGLPNYPHISCAAVPFELRSPGAVALPWG
jgi:hypothetical protein